MGPCTGQSRKSIHCMGRKRCIFAHFALKILLTARSKGTITNSIAVLKSSDGGAVCSLGAQDSPPRILGPCLWITACCTRDDPSLYLPLPPSIFHVITPPVVNLYQCTILCFYDNALQIICAGVSSVWMRAFGGGEGFHPHHKKKGREQWKKFLGSISFYIKAPMAFLEENKKPSMSHPFILLLACMLSLVISLSV